MKDLTTLWQGRLRDFVASMSRYGRLILNDHMALILMVCFGFFSIYYQQALLSLQDQQPAYLSPLVTGLTGLVWWAGLSWGRPLLLTVEPDKSYLFARGHEWHRVWRRGVWLGAVFPSLVLATATLLLAPFLSLAWGWPLNDALWLIAYVVVAKYVIAYLGYLRFFRGALPVALSSSWWALGFTSLGLLAGALPVAGRWILLGLALVASGSLVLWGERRLTGSWIQFEALVAQEQARTAGLYRWLALFAEVPRQVPPVKRRAYLDGVVNALSRRWSNRYAYLYIRHLIRNTAYSGIWLRVLAFFSLVLLSSQAHWLWWVAGSLSSVLTLIQLMPLVYEPLRHPLEGLYPVGRQSLVGAFRPVVAALLAVQLLVYALILVLVSGGQWAVVGLSLAIWLGVAGVGLLGYLPFWLQRHPATDD